MGYGLPLFYHKSIKKYIVTVKKLSQYIKKGQLD